MILFINNDMLDCRIAGSGQHCGCTGGTAHSYEHIKLKDQKDKQFTPDIAHLELVIEDLTDSAVYPHCTFTALSSPIM